MNNRNHGRLILAGLSLVTAAACAASAPPPVPVTGNMFVTNHTAGRVELWVIGAPGEAARLLGQLGAGKVGQYAVPTTARVSAYLGSGITRTQVTCTYPRDDAGRMLVDCGKAN